MKRTLIFIILAAVGIFGLYFVKTALPFIPVAGASMEPTYEAGDLIIVGAKDASEVKVGDIIVYNIPLMVREYYGYPTVVAHRVIEVNDANTVYGVVFRTKGDNASEDPFTVRPSDLRGEVTRVIPKVGIPILFLQSQQGFIFALIALALFSLYLYGKDIRLGKEKIQKGLFSPLLEENRRRSQVFEARMGSTEQTLARFTGAIENYGEHLKSHTSAIQGMSDASQELRKSTSEQNVILGRLTEVLEQSTSSREEVHKVEQVVPRVELVCPMMGLERSAGEPVTPQVEAAPEKKLEHPPGCIRSKQPLVKKEKILSAG